MRTAGPATRLVAVALAMAGAWLPPRAVAAQPSSAEEATRAADVRATTIVLRTPERGVDVWVTEAWPYARTAEGTLYPAASPCVSPCRLVLPNGRYELDVGGTEFHTHADGPPQLWDVVPAATWARNLAIALDVVGGLLVLGDLLYYGARMMGPLSWFAEPGEVEARQAQVREEILPTVIALGVIGGLFVVGSIPLYVHYSSSGSAAGQEAVEEGEEGVSVSPGAVVLPDARGMPAFALSLSGTWGPVRRVHHRTHR